MNNHDLEQLVKDAVQSLQRARTSVRASDAELAKALQAISVLSGFSVARATVPAADRRMRVAIVNGRRLTDNELQNLNEDNYHVILDLTAAILRYRENPERRSALRLSDLRGIGPYRIKILAFMIECLGTPLCADNVDDLLADTMRAATPQAFTKSISILRKALGGGGRGNPYIQSIAAWELSQSNNAHACVLNSEWKYLLVRHGKF